MIDTTKPIYSRPDGTVCVILENGYPYHVVIDDPLFEEAQAYLAENPEALQPEPMPPPPTPEQIRSGLIAQLSLIDAQSIRPMRAGETDRVAELESKAAALRTQLAALTG
jgi:hypothetical protein